MANNLINVKNGNQLVTLTDEMIIKKTDEFVNGMSLPENYDYNKAIKSFCLALPDVKDIEKASARSIFLTAQDYVNKNLDISKNQCALIVYGNSLKLQKQYQGNVALAKKNNPDIKDITSSAIYEGDKVAIKKENGKTIIDHQTSFENMNHKVIGAYATVLYNDGTSDSEIMPISAIELSWSMSRAGTSVHKKFPSQMARKTVLNKLCLNIINSSVDSDSKDYVKDDMEQYEETINNQDNANSNIDYENAISMDDVVEKPTPKKKKVEKAVVVEQAPIEEVVELDSNKENVVETNTNDVAKEIKEKREAILKELNISSPISKEQESEEPDEDVIDRFNKMNQEASTKVENVANDGTHCEKCGKALTPTSIAFYNKHLDKKRLCYTCSKEEN